MITQKVANNFLAREQKVDQDVSREQLIEILVKLDVLQTAPFNPKAKPT
jgi:hypothetical protein